MSTAVILLASGRSKRFDGDKLLAPFLGEPLMCHAAKKARCVPCDHFFAVTNASPERQGRLIDIGYRLVINPAPQDGQGAAIALGARAAMAAGAKQVLIVLADMPMVSEAHMNATCIAGQAAYCVMSEHQGVLSPPASFREDALRQLTQLTGDQGVKPKRDDVTTVSFSLIEAKDIDTRA